MAPGTLPRILPRILIAGTDTALCRSLAEQLERHGEFACVEGDGAACALQIAAEGAIDAVLLDAALPGLDARELRRRTPQAAIIVLTGPNGTGAAGAGFDGIADDYITKPIRLNELLERLRLRLRPGKPGDDGVLTIGPYDFRPGAKLLIDRRSGSRVRLTEKETAILDYLYRAAGRVIDRYTLLDAVWGYRAAVTTHTLETHVYRLRRKIEYDPAHARILVTEAGGYRLLA